MAVPTASPHSSNLFDTVLSASMIVASFVFAIFVYVQTGTGRLTSYELATRLRDAGGLALGSDVRIGGMKVGSITGLELRDRPYQAVIRFRLRDDLLIPEDSTLTVASSGMSNGVYLAIRPGRSRHTVAPGGTLETATTRVSPRRTLPRMMPSS